MRGRRWLAGGIALCLCVATVSAAASRLTSSDAADEERLGANAQRFMDLTGGTDSSAATLLDADDGEDGEVPSAFAPRGWRITPAGQQVEVFRFPLGLTATGDGSHIMVSSDNGGMQGLSVIDTATLATTTTPAGNLFMGVASAPNGQVYASGGNADRVFRFTIAGGVAASLDA